MADVVKVYISKEFKMIRETILKVNTFLNYSIISKVSTELHLQIIIFNLKCIIVFNL